MEAQDEPSSQALGGARTGAGLADIVIASKFLEIKRGLAFPG